MPFRKQGFALVILVAILIALLSGAPVRAQQTGSGSICVLAFEDDTHSGARQSGDALLSDVSVNLMVNDKVVIANHVTDGKEPFCFPDLPAQQYTVSFSSPLYEPTTLTSYTFSLAAGERVTREFGAAKLQATAAATASGPGGLTATTPGRIGISAAGAVLVMDFIGGIGLIIYGLFVHRR